MKTYRKKPVEITAVQFTGTAEEATPIIDWILDGGGTARYHEAVPPQLHSVHCRCDGRGIVPGGPEGWTPGMSGGHAVSCPETEPKGPGDPEHLAIDTMEGTMRADVGDWIIRGVQGEHYPCKPDIFEATYDEVSNAEKLGRPWGEEAWGHAQEMGDDA